MSLIDSSNIESKLQELIEDTDLGRIKSTQLSALLKTCVDAGLPHTELQEKLYSMLYNKPDLYDFLMLAMASNLITTDSYVSAVDLSELQNPNISPGSVYFIETEGIPYIKKLNGEWIPIDPSAQVVFSENMWSWGSGARGKLGINSVATQSIPNNVVSISDWTQVSAGKHDGEYSVAIRADGSVMAWGSNEAGQLADNTVFWRSSPVSILGNFSDWTHISAGHLHCMGVRADGSAWAWGSGANGRLGGGLTLNRSSPVPIIGNDWVQVESGKTHSLGIRSNGTAWSWGWNSGGRLGDGTLVDRSSPVLIAGGFTDWTQISAGEGNSLGLRANGTIWSWGDNANGRLGDGTRVPQSSPVSVIGGFTDWTKISAGWPHCAAIRANGTVWAWGWNGDGQLGINASSTAHRSSPVLVAGGFTDWISVSAGGGHTTGVRANGTAWAWGLNNSGQLGDGTTTIRRGPVTVFGNFTDFVDISAGWIHTHALRSGQTR